MMVLWLILQDNQIHYSTLHTFYDASLKMCLYLTLTLYYLDIQTVIFLFFVMRHIGATSTKKTNKMYHILILYVLCNIWKLIYINIFTCTKYVHQMLANLQHVSLHHRCHHLGVLSVAITVPSKCPFHSE
jgi:hypothetical protein